MKALPLALLLAAAPAIALAGDDARQDVPRFELKDLSGKRVRLDDFAGKVVVVNFWATWCVPCIHELPHLQRLQEQYADKGLVILAITTDGPETLSEVRKTVRSKKWTMPILLDQDGSVKSRLNPRGTNPYTLFVDRRGRRAHDHEGYIPGDEKSYEKTIVELLAEKP